MLTRLSQFVSLALLPLGMLYAQGSANIVISQVYGGGGNTGTPAATYKNDFIELFNRGAVAVSLNGWSVQYNSAAGTSAWQVTELTNVLLQPGQYYLVQEAQGTGGTTNLPTPDATGNIPMSATAGRVALVKQTTALSGSVCPSGSNLVDLVGFGSTASCSETSPAPGLNNATAAVRALGGCTDTDNNSTDFTAINAAPRNSATALNVCGAPTNPGAISSATPNPVPVGFSVALAATLSPGANPTSTGLSASCNLSEIGGSTSFSLPGSYTVPANTVSKTYNLPCTVSDDQSRTGNFTIALAVKPPPPVLTCGAGKTNIGTVQGPGNASPIVGSTVEVEGIVTANFQASDLKGFFLQESDSPLEADNDPNTSNGVFIFDNSFGVPAPVGSRVRVAGTVAESFNRTQIGNISSIQVCPAAGSVNAVDINFPLSAVADWEKYEGMKVRFPQTLTVNGTNDLAHFGQFTLGLGRSYQPTQIVLPGVAATTQQNLNNRSSILLDDASNVSDPSPTLYPIGGLNATSNTLRAGYTVASGWEAVVDYSFSEYRVFALNPSALTIQAASNPRTTAPDAVGGRFRVVGWNVLNYFTSFGGSNRGAANATEFQKQKAKIVAAIVALNPDVIGLTELQNNGDVAITDLVNAINAVAGPGTYAFVSTGPLGTDLITNGILYQPLKLAPVGTFASRLPPAGVSSRPTLAQRFVPVGAVKPELQQFTVYVNHWKSKASAGSLPGDADQNDGQSPSNASRVAQANDVLSWINANPTADPTPVATRKFVLLGDFNAYAKEDPIRILEAAGYKNLATNILGLNSYSYNFSAQSGSLDHAISNPVFFSLVSGVTEWHINSDEPPVFEYNTTNPAYYNAGPYRASDHDPVLMGFNPLPGDLNDDGMVDAADGNLLRSKLGKHPGEEGVDRRMDIDGDGVITLTDYKLWSSYYSAFIR
ncbi:ExeM/NucH family extracellular endonuclease [Bryobacter aggregatus]|uniref:ExeM/NucH family extracellular endonuclease n=1 Tax=Bryobacter aggregatus TaxID=360054 RepID=UPI00068BFAE8|nr:ExeM/NucH family extracellular endonuclease [Bryobacter aggregatus]